MIDQSILDRIQKLFRLTESPNEHEAQLAAAMAAELLAKHQLSEAEVRLAGVSEEAPEQAGEVSLREAKVNDIWRSVLLQGVAGGFGCVAYISKGQGVVLRLIGRVTPLSAARYTYAYLEREIGRIADAEWLQNRGLTRVPVRTWKDSFRKGMAIRLAERLRTRRQEVVSAASENAIVLVREDEAELRRILEAKGTRQSRQRLFANPDAFEQGKAAGERVVLSGEPTLPSARASLGTRLQLEAKS